MITIDQANLLLEQYTDRGIKKQEIRSYEVSLWTLQDSFITVLKWSDVEQKGRIEHPKMVLKTDGTQNFSFSVPMFYYKDGKKVENANWYSVRNGNNFTSMRKIKVIFNKHTDYEGVFEFIIINLTESHEGDIATCEVECEGLAFHELGKIGYNLVLSQDVFEVDYTNWVNNGAIGKQPIQSLNYWCEKIGLKPQPSDPADRYANTWYYKVDMVWSSFSDAGERSPNKIYEESYTTSWNSDLAPVATSELQEKARAVKAENSNVYNITQSIAEAFMVFCRYEYDHDENYNITSRTVVFYNNYLKENERVFTLSYPHSSTKISRSMDGSGLTTKLFVSDVDDDSVYEGYHSIMNAEVNPTRENYLLNFDYMLKIGTISDEQYRAIVPFNQKVRQLNDRLMLLQRNLAAYQERKPKLEAKIKIYERGKDQAQIQINQDQAIIDKIVEDYPVDHQYTSVDAENPDRQYIRTDVENGNYITPNSRNRGIFPESVRIYTTYDYTNKTLTDEITNFWPEFDDYGNLAKLRGMAQQEDFVPVFLTYNYRPKLYYEEVMRTWQEVRSQHDMNLTKAQLELGDEDYKYEEEGATGRAYTTLMTAIGKGRVRATIETDYFKRPHVAIIKDDGKIYIMTYDSITIDNTVVSPILPNGMRISDHLLRQYLATFFASGDLNFTLDEVNGAISNYTFADIFMGQYNNAADAEAAAVAYHEYHAAVMNDVSNGIIGEIGKCTAEIEGLIRYKATVLKEFEETMGPSLREGYWQPENYNDFGIKLEDEQTLVGAANNITTSDHSDTGQTFKIVWETDVQEDEQDIFFYRGIKTEQTWYPCINLSSVPNVVAHIKDYSFVYNNTYMESTSETDWRNIQSYKVGANAIFMYVTDSSRTSVFPALVLTGAKNMSDQELTRMKSTGHPRLVVITSTTDSSTGTNNFAVDSNRTVSITSSMWQFGGGNINTCYAVYPRVKFSSIALRTGTNDLILHYNGRQLKKYEDYSVLARTTKDAHEDYTTAFYVTLKPETIASCGGTGHTLKINYVLSNANTAIYLDAKIVSEENAEPKVSYDITPNLLGNEISATLYNRLAQIVMINDTDLKLQNTFGYIGELELDLDDVSQDTIRVKNYKTKFEDLFSSIVASTEAMKFGANALEAAMAGDIPLTDEVFSDLLSNHEGEFSEMIQEYLDENAILDQRLDSALGELAEIINNATMSQEHLHALSLDNASILSSFVENIGDSLSSAVYRSPTKPASYKFGDIWYKTDANGAVLARYVATSTNDNSNPDATDSLGFVQTYDGSLGEIRGAHFNINTVKGMVDIVGQNRINIRAGTGNPGDPETGVLYLAAGNEVRIVGNNEINIGGSKINICSLYELDEDGNPTTTLREVQGINLIAAAYDPLGNYGPNTSRIMLTPKKLELGASDIIMKAASGIRMYASDGTNANTAGVAISATEGIQLASGAGISLFGGTVSDTVSIGPNHRDKFEVGHIWIKIPQQTGADAHNSYDGNPTLTLQQMYYYTRALRSNSIENPSTTIHKYRAKLASKDAVGKSDSEIWEEDNTIDAMSQTVVTGASFQVNDKWLLMGYDNVLTGSANSTVLEMTEDHIILSAAQQVIDNQAKLASGKTKITGFNNGLSGVVIAKDSIGIGLNDPNGNNTMNVIVMNGDYGILMASAMPKALGQGEDNLDISTLTAAQLEQRYANSNNSTGSFVRIGAMGLELGSKSSLYINTTNFKLVNNTIDHAIMAFGVGAQGVTSSTTVTQMNAMPNLRFAVNDNGAFFRGRVVAESVTLIDNNTDVNLAQRLLDIQSQLDNVVDSFWGEGIPLPMVSDQVTSPPNGFTDAEKTIIRNNARTIGSTTSMTQEQLDAIPPEQIGFKWLDFGEAIKHKLDIYYNNKTGATFKWVKNNTGAAYDYAWRYISTDMTLASFDSSIKSGRDRLEGVITGDVSLAFSGTDGNIYTNLDNTLGLVIIGKQITSGDFTGKYPFFRVSNNAMGFFVANSPTAALEGMSIYTNATDNIIDSDRAMLYYDNGNLYIAGTLFADRVYTRYSNGNTITLREYIWNSINEQGANGQRYMDQVNTNIELAVKKATEFLTAARQGQAELDSIAADSFAWLAEVKEDIAAKYLPTITSGSSHPVKFKVGDIWKQLDGSEYTAMYNWDELYYTTAQDGTRIGNSAVAETKVTSTEGWNRTYNGRLANIVGTDIAIDTVAGTINIYAESTIDLAAKLNLTLTSNDIEITGNHSVKIGGGTSVEISAGSSGTGGTVNILATGASGNSAILMSPSQLKIGSAANIIVESGSSVLIRANTQGAVNAVQMDQNGIQMGSNKTITLSSSSEISEGTNVSTHFSLQPDHLIFGFSGSTGTLSTTNYIRIDQNQILMAAGTSMPDAVNLRIGDLSGMSIKQGELLLVANGNNNASIISIEPDEILIGTGSTKAAALNKSGSFISIFNDQGISNLQIGTNGVLTMATPNLQIDTSATGNNYVFSLSPIDPQNGNYQYIRYSGNGALDIRASSIKVTARSLEFTGSDSSIYNFGDCVKASYKEYTISTSSSTLTAPSGNDPVWTTKIPNKATNQYFWSRIVTEYYDKTTTYTTPVYEQELSDKNIITEIMYMRRPTAITIDENTDPYNYAGFWLPYLEARSKATNRVKQEVVNGKTENLSVDAKPYIYSCVRIYHLETRRYTYHNMEHRTDLEAADTSYYLADDVRTGIGSVPVVNSTGIYVNGDAIDITATGVLTFLAGGKLFIGTTTANNALIFDENGVLLKTDRRFYVTGDSGKFILDSSPDTSTDYHIKINDANNDTIFGVQKNKTVILGNWTITSTSFEYESSSNIFKLVPDGTLNVRISDSLRYKSLKLYITGSITSNDKDVEDELTSGTFYIKKNGWVHATGISIGDIWHISQTKIRTQSSWVGIQSPTDIGHANNDSLVFWIKGTDNEIGIGSSKFRIYSDGFLFCEGIRFKGDGVYMIKHTSGTDIGVKTFGNDVYLTSMTLMANANFTGTDTNTKEVLLTNIVDVQVNPTTNKVTSLKLLGYGTNGETTLNFTNANVLDHFTVTKNTGSNLNVGAYDAANTKLARIKTTAAVTNNGMSSKVRFSVEINDTSNADAGVSATLQYANDSNNVTTNTPYIDIDISAVYKAGWNDCRNAMSSATVYSTTGGPYSVEGVGNTYTITQNTTYKWSQPAAK